MKLYFKQRFFSWFSSYDIYGEDGETVYTVEGQLAWGHCLHILDRYGDHIATVRQRLWTFLPRFDLYVRERYIGCVQKEFYLLTPRYRIECDGWQVEGSFTEWNYTVRDGNDALVATVSKELFRLTDTYLIDVVQEKDALHALMLVLAIDAEKASRSQ
ncbi:MAG: LURP-one-related family protein [Oscillibacter sp.]|nr:LURP-one-related family protein [Oscillibacter sp.]